MPAVRSTKTTPKAKPASSKKAPRSKSAAQIFPAGEWQTLFEAKQYDKAIDLIIKHPLDPATATTEQLTQFCRAFYHVDKTKVKKPWITLAEKISQHLLAENPAQVEALLCQAILAALKEDFDSACDKALEAMKASQYKDQDSLNLMQEYQKKRYSNTSETAAPAPPATPDQQDYYATLNVTSAAPVNVIKAAHKALAFKKGTPQAKVADEALAILSDSVKRSAYDTLRSNRITGGGGKEFSGGSEMLKQLGEALGLKFPEGFEFPANGRFQGGFGGGFEFTWGE